MPKYGYQWATGWDNAVGLANIEGISVPGATRTLNQAIHGLFLDPNTHYFVSASPTEENRLALADGTFLSNGYIRQQWVFQLMSDDALAYFRSTLAGKHTITTKSDDVYENYDNWNAIIDKPFPTRDQRLFEYGIWWFRDVIVPIKLVRAPT